MAVKSGTVMLRPASDHALLLSRFLDSGFQMGLQVRTLRFVQCWLDLQPLTGRGLMPDGLGNQMLPGLPPPFRILNV